MVHVRAVKVCLIAMVTAFVALATAIVLMFSASVSTLSPDLVAKIVTVGGTGNPTAGGIQRLLGGVFAEGRTVAPIWTPQQFWPVLGPMTLHESTTVGRDNVVAWFELNEDDDMVLVTISQGAVVVSRSIAHWNDNPATAPSPDHLKLIVLLANPMRPNGGVLARFPGLSVFGITGFGPTEQSAYQVIDAANAYDLYATAPLYLNNLLSWANALAGVAFPYNGGNSIHGQDPDFNNPDLEVHKEVHNNTTYYTVFQKNLPILEPLRMAGLGALADAIQPLVKVWVDAGYYKNSPAASPGVHMPAELFMPIENVIRALVQSPGAILEGLATIPRNLGIVPRHSVQPSQTDQTPAGDDVVNESDNNLMMSSMSDTSQDSSDSKEGDEIVADPQQPQPPVNTDDQGDGGQPASPGLDATLGGDSNGLESLNQSPQAPGADLPKEGLDGEDKKESLKNEDEPKKNEDDDESLSTSLGSKFEDKDDKKGLEGRKSEVKNDDLGDDAKKDDNPTSRKTAEPNDNEPSRSSAGNQDNDKANAA